MLDAASRAQTPAPLCGETGSHDYMHTHVKQMRTLNKKAKRTTNTKFRTTLEAVREPGPDNLIDVDRTLQRTDAPRHNWTLLDPEHGGKVQELWARGGYYEPDTRGTIFSGMRQREPGADGMTVAPYRHSATPELTMPSGPNDGNVQSKDWRRYKAVNDHELDRIEQMGGSRALAKTMPLGGGRRSKGYDLRTPKQGQDWVASIGGTRRDGEGLRYAQTPKNHARAVTRELQDATVKNIFMNTNRDVASRREVRNKEEVAKLMTRARPDNSVH